MKEILTIYYEKLIVIATTIIVTLLLSLIDSISIHIHPVSDIDYFLGNSKYVAYFLLSLSLASFIRAISVSNSYIATAWHKSKEFHIRTLGKDAGYTMLSSVMSAIWMAPFNLTRPLYFAEHNSGAIGYFFSVIFKDVGVYAILVSLVITGYALWKMSFNFTGIIEFVGDSAIYMVTPVIKKLMPTYFNKEEIKLNFKTLDNGKDNIIYSEPSIASTAFKSVPVYQPTNTITPKTSVSHLSNLEPVVDDRDSVVIQLEDALKRIGIVKDKFKDSIIVNPNYFRGPMVSTLEFSLPSDEGAINIGAIEDQKKINELTRLLKQQTLRLFYKVKGTDSIFVELPNDKFDNIHFMSTLEKGVDITPSIDKMALPTFFGVTTKNIPRIYDLAKFPHLLIAGKTGSGKTVGLHGIIASLMTLRQDTVEFILIDPKFVEMVHYGNSKFLSNINSPYQLDNETQGIDTLNSAVIKKIRDSNPKSICWKKSNPLSTITIDSEFDLFRDTPKNIDIPVDDSDMEFVGYSEDGLQDGIIVDMDYAMDVFNRLVVLMEIRLTRLRALRVSNIEAYNNRYDELGGVIHQNNTDYTFDKMKYIVLIVDEFKDLKMQYPKEIEIPITRLAQKARAVGIHLIICTQRPDVSVISGSIKANLPAKLAYKVSSHIDSSVIGVDDAHKLLGRGDSILYCDVAFNERLHSAFIDVNNSDELSRISQTN